MVVEDLSRGKSNKLGFGVWGELTTFNSIYSQNSEFVDQLLSNQRTMIVDMISQVTGVSCCHNEEA